MSTVCRRRSASAATTSRRSSASISASPRARRSVSSASRVRASRRWPRRCSACTKPTRAAQITLRGRPMAGKATKRVEESIRAIQMVFQNPDSALNRVVDGAAHPDPFDHQAHRPQGRRSRRAGDGGRRGDASVAAPPRHAAAPALGWPEAACGDRPSVRRRSRTSWCATSRRRRSTCRCRPPSSTCWRRSSATSARATCSSATTSASCATSPTASRSCTSAGSWSSASTEQIFEGPNHPYTEALLSAVPSVDGVGREPDPAHGGDPVTGEPAVGLCVPHSLSPRGRRSVRGDRTRDARALTGPQHQVPPHHRTVDDAGGDHAIRIGRHRRLNAVQRGGSRQERMTHSTPSAVSRTSIPAASRPSRTASDTA